MEYDHLGSRVSSIGAMTLSYDHLGTRPRTVDIAGDGLAEADLLALYFVLHHIHEVEDRRRSSN